MGPEIVRDTLYRFELNLREALVLGLVGAGGVGARIEGYVRGGAFDRAATFTLIVVAFVLAIELANSVYRRLVR
jgi:phosphonate transport system permease protein